MLVFAKGDAERIAREAGADYAGGDELIQRIARDEWTDFDVAIATPDIMGDLGRACLGRILGRRGLMPNPKSGTVVQVGDLPRVIADVRRGKVDSATIRPVCSMSSSAKYRSHRSRSGTTSRR